MDYNDKLELKLQNEEAAGGLSHFHKTSNMKLIDRDNFHRNRMIKHTGVDKYQNPQNGLLGLLFFSWCFIYQFQLEWPIIDPSFFCETYYDTIDTIN